MKSSAGHTPTLGDGRLPFWRRTRPLLAVDVAAPSEEEQAQTAPSRWIAATARGLAVGLVGLLLLTLAAWVILGVTVRPTPRVGGEMWAVQWAAWPEGAAPEGALVAVTGEPVERGILARLGYQFGSGDVTVQQVVAGPGGIVSTDDALEVFYQGVATGLTSKTPIEEQSLGNAYLAVCLAGCDAREGYVSRVPVDNVMGEALGPFQPPFSYRSPQGTGVAGE